MDDVKNSSNNFPSEHNINVKIEYPRNVNTILDIIAEVIFSKLDIVSKSLSGLVFFLILDFILGGVLNIYSDNFHSLYLSKKILQIYEIYLKPNGFSIYIFTVIIYMLLWSWGKFILFLAKSYILDNIKENYDQLFNKEIAVIKNLKILREKVINKLFRNEKWLKEENIPKDMLTDYMLYLILGGFRELQSKNIRTRNKLAEETAFYLVNISLVILIVMLTYVLILYINSKYGLATIFLLILSFYIFLLYNAIYKYILRKVASIYISRNIRLYINYLKLEK